MLAYCLSDGLTCNMKVFRRGDIFALPRAMEGEFGELSSSQLATKQRKTYRKELFRWPTDEEIVEAYRAGDVSINDCSPRERLMVADKRGQDGVKLQEAAKVLRDKVIKDNPELDEKEDEVEPVQVEHIASITETAPAKKTTSAKKITRKTTARKTTTRKVTKE